MAQQTFTGRKRVRKFFGHIKEVAEMPNLIEVQKASYDQFLMVEEPQGGRLDEGLQAVFRSVFPISDFSGTSMLEFVRYEFEPPKYDVDECRQRGMTYAAPLKVTLRLIVFDIDQETAAKSVKDIKEQDVYMGDIPLMTNNGTFIVNGTERVIVSQMHRSPGVFFDHDKGKTHSSGKLLFAARIIPYRGSWLDFEFDAKDIIHVRIDRRRKLPITTLLYALGLDGEEILHYYYNSIPYTEAKEGGWRTPFDPQRYRGLKPAVDLTDAKTKKIVVEAGKKITPRLARKLADDGLKELLVRDEDLYGHYLADELVNPQTGEIYAEAGDEIDEKLLKGLKEAGLTKLNLLDIDHINTGAYSRNTMRADKAENYEQALLEIDRVMRPGEPPTRETAEALFNGLFFDSERYDLSAVGRVKMNMRLELDAPDTQRTLRKEDILSVIKTLHGLRDGKGDIDDIDHLGNRRVRSVGELMENQYRLGLVRMERAIKERMSSIDIDTVMPHDLINAKPVAAAVREFFGSSQLSQFMDQTNPLSEVTHKRRLSALGPGGLTRECAGFEVRDVHPTHYGRIASISWTCRRSNSYRWPRRSSRSWRTTMPTARSWARTCSVRPCRSCSRTLRSSVPVWRPSSRATRARLSRRGAAAWSTKSMRLVSSCAPRRRQTRRSRASTSTACRSSSAPTRAPASRRSLWCASVTLWLRATSSPMVPQPNSVNWRWAATSSSPSCRGTATTLRTRSSCPS